MARLRSIVARRDVRALVAIFLVSRLTSAAVGVTFDSSLLRDGWQVLDVELLRDNPVESIWYLHSQPPLYNAVLAVALNVAGDAAVGLLRVTWQLAGLGTMLLLYWTVLSSGVRRTVAFPLVVLFMLSPGVLLFEHWLFYSELEMFLVAVLLAGVAAFARTRSAAALVTTFASFAGLVLLRSVFHPLLFVVFSGFIVLRFPEERRRILVVAAVPFLVLATWGVKSVVLFDSWSNSSWLGMNLWRSTLQTLTPEAQQELERTANLSPTAALPAFDGPETYTPHFHAHRYGVAATDDVRKSTGQPNYNAALYLPVARQYMDDSLAVIRETHGRSLAKAQVNAYLSFLRPADDYFLLAANRREIAPYADWFDRVVLLTPSGGRVSNPAATIPRGDSPASWSYWADRLPRVSYTLLGVQVIALVAGVWALSARRVRRFSRQHRSRLRAGIVAPVALTALLVSSYAAVTSNLVESLENNRFQLEVMPAALVLFAIGLEVALSRLRPGSPRPEAEHDGEPPARPDAVAPEQATT